MNYVKDKFEWKNTDDKAGFDVVTRLVMFLGKLRVFDVVGYGSSARNGVVTERYILIGR